MIGWKEGRRPTRARSAKAKADKLAKDALDKARGGAT
jgi:hypothetical protein